jgi:hypothetical protein
MALGTDLEEFVTSLAKVATLAYPAKAKNTSAAALGIFEIEPGARAGLAAGANDAAVINTAKNNKVMPASTFDPRAVRLIPAMFTSVMINTAPRAKGIRFSADTYSATTSAMAALDAILPTRKLAPARKPQVGFR